MGTAMNPPSMSEAKPAATRRRGRIQLLLIVLGVIGPMLLGLYNANPAARGLVTHLPHHALSEVPVVGQPIRFDGAAPLSATGAPALGGQTRFRL